MNGKIEFSICPCLVLMLKHSFGSNQMGNEVGLSVCVDQGGISSGLMFPRSMSDLSK